MKKYLSALLFFVSLSPQVVEAHAFGQQYNLPIPLELYLTGGGAVVGLSFLVIAIFFRKIQKKSFFPKLELTQCSFVKIFIASTLSKTLQIIGLILFIFTISTGLIGKNSAIENWNMTFFWIIFLLGMSYISMLFGNIWEVLNPLKTLTEITEWITKKSMLGIFSYPQKFGYYPAFLGYFLLVWFELIQKTSPVQLSLLLLAYTTLTILGIILIGKKSWFKYCDFFSVFFDLLSKSAPFQKKGHKVYFQLPFSNLIEEKPEHGSLLLIILFMLSSTAFDGLSETGAWYRFYFDYLYGKTLLLNNLSFIQSISLFLSSFFFLIIYAIFIGLMKFFSKTKLSVTTLALEFAYTLIPIALAYNIAHYYTLLLIQGQDIIHLISDPFAFGWNLFGTANFKPNIGIVGAGFIWNSQVVLIVVGHVIAIYLSHIKALQLFKSQKTAFLSQIPMLFLMIIYTIIGLWILSLPLNSGNITNQTLQNEPVFNPAIHQPAMPERKFLDKPQAL